jgi:hypothetical protein
MKSEREDIPIVSASSKSTVNSYRMVWCVWIGLSLVYIVVYWHLAVLHGRLLQGCVLASAFLIQALLVPAYVWREKFSSGAGAAIQAASAAVSVVGIPATLLALTESSLRPSGLNPHYFDFAYADTHGLQFGYVTTILVLSGIAGGTALGILRWRILQAEALEASIPSDSEESRSWWNRYLRSALPWAATATLCSWLVEAFAWATRLAPGVWLPHQNDLPAEVLLGFGGLLFIVPFAIRARDVEAASREVRVRKYFLIAMRSVAIFAAVKAIPWVFWALGVFVGYCVLLAPPCLLWAILYERSEPLTQKIVQPRQEESTPSHLKREKMSNRAIVLLSTAGLACSLFLGMIATAPVSMMAHGVGCLAFDGGTSAEMYWFWRAYKGIGSEARIGTKMILRPSVDRSTCLILNERAVDGIDDPREVTKGYVGAARAWAWLIDSEQWDGERSKQIRAQLTRLLGRDFSSYDELVGWWRKSSEYLAWSGTDELLEVREPQEAVHPEPSDDYIRRPYVIVPFKDEKFEVPVFFGSDPFGASQPPRDGHQRLPWDEFRLYGDREARLRGLKLDATACIDILTGEQDRRAQEYLHNAIGEKFSTYSEWRSFFGQSPRRNPWRLKRGEADGWIKMLQEGWSTPGAQKAQISFFQAQTGLASSSPEDFINWLRNPENTRYDEWANAQIVFGSAYDDPELHKRNSAVVWLKMTTGETFDSPEDWVRWWQANHSNLSLSANGMKLVIKAK